MLFQRYFRSLSNWLPEFSLRRLFFLHTSFLLFIAIGVGSYLWWTDYEVEVQSTAVANAIDRVRFAQQLQIDLAAHRRNLLFARLTDDPKRWEVVRKFSSELRQDTYRLGKLMTRGDHPHLKKLELALELYLAEPERANNKKIRSIAMVVQPNPEFDRTLEAADAVVRYNTESALRIQSSIVERGERVKFFGFSLALAVLIFASLLFVLLRHLLIYPLSLLSRTISRVSQTGFVGDFVPILGVTDVRKIGHSFNQMMARLKEQDELRYRFIAAIAHDIRSPVSAMDMSVDLLSEEDEKTFEERGSLLRILKRQIKSLVNLTNDLTDSASIQAGRLRMKSVPLNFSDAVAQATSLYRLKTSHQWDLQIKPGSYFIMADPDRLSQVLNNILGNAIKYSPQGGKITVQVASEKGECSVAITDQGVGIPEAELRTIFEPFRRSTRTDEMIPGLGLGLATSLKIVRTFGGTISVISKAGEGSTFFITFPIYDQEAQNVRTSVLY